MSSVRVDCLPVRENLHIPLTHTIGGTKNQTNPQDSLRPDQQS